MREENIHAGGKWETMNFLGVALVLLQKCHSNTWQLVARSPVESRDLLDRTCLTLAFFRRGFCDGTGSTCLVVPRAFYFKTTCLVVPRTFHFRGTREILSRCSQNQDLTVLLEFPNCCIRVSDCLIRVFRSYFHEV